MFIDGRCIILLLYIHVFWLYFEIIKKKHSDLNLIWFVYTYWYTVLILIRYTVLFSKLCRGVMKAVKADAYLRLLWDVRWESLTPPRLDTSPLLVNSQHIMASNFSWVDYKTITMAVDELLWLRTQHATSTTTLWLEQVTFSEVRLHYKSRSPLC